MGASASKLVREHEYLAHRVVSSFHAIDANNSGSLSVSEVAEFFNHVDIKGKDSAIQAHRWFYAMNINKHAMINLEEYKQYFARKLDEDGVSATLAMLELIEDLIPQVVKSKGYVRLSSLSAEEENRSAKVEVALAALTEAQEKMKEEANTEISMLDAMNHAACALSQAQHEMKEEAKMADVDATAHVALDSLADAKEKLKEEAKLEAAVEAALEDAVNALDEARHEMKGEAKLDQVVESAALRAVDEAKSAIKVTKHKIAEEERMEQELGAAIEATRKVVSESRCASSEAKVEQALETAVNATNKALLGAKAEREAGSFTEKEIGIASNLIKDAEAQAN
jgi:hypothetical protein